MISVIIPTLNEELVISSLLETLDVHPLIREIVVCDGGSTDNTEVVAARFTKVLLLKCDRGRAKQMNAGASRAKSDVLLFLHADSIINPDNVKGIMEAMRKYDAGSFYLKFDESNKLLNLYSRISRVNMSLFTYGDQGLFIKKELFKKLNGFRDIPILEDYEIVKRLFRAGCFKKVNIPLTTSARRFRKNGVIRQQLKNILIVALFEMGVSSTYLARFYRY